MWEKIILFMIIIKQLMLYIIIALYFIIIELSEVKLLLFLKSCYAEEILRNCV